MTKTICFSAAALTLLIAGLFVFPARSVVRTSYAPLKGSLLNAPGEPQQAAGSANILNIPSIPKPKLAPSVKKLQEFIRTGHKKPAKNANAKKQRAKPAKEVKTTVAAEPARTLAASAFEDKDSIPQYALEDIMDAFENDPSKYPLKESKTAEGVTLSLAGLEKKDKMFVLKIAMDNETDSDFFVREFQIRSSGRILASRALFRIIVESRRVREGYVLFEKPGPGAHVDIELREDGGKERSIDLPIAYQF